MKKSISLFCLFIFICTSTNLFAQKTPTRPNYQLLWKISGNGLKKPSYLFGTMHLRDKRVFDFSDSVLVKLEECESFAMEVTPDSMLSEVFSILMGEEESIEEDDLEENLSTEEYKDLEERLKSEGIDIEKIKHRSPKKIMKLLTNPLPQKGDKETFLDAYLYRIARENNKNIVGLEKIKEHVSALKESYSDQIKQLKTYIKYEGPKKTQSMIDIYWEGNISKIEKFYDGADSAYMENLLYKRNEKMRDKMAELMKERSTFTAVGAGHLPGQKGLIELLKKMGYTVTPVNATFTGLAAKYKEKTLNTDWVRFNVEDHLYSAEFPSTPILYSKNSIYNSASKLYIYPDLATGLFYYSISVPLAKTSDSDPNILLEQYIKTMSGRGNYKILNKKKIIYKGYEGIEALLVNTSKGIHLKVKMLVRKNSLYVLMLGSYNETLLSGKDPERFFQSLELKDYKNSSWQSFKNDEGAFSINTPYELKKTESIVNGENGKVEIKMFNTTDQNKGISYYVVYYNFAAGSVITEDSAYFELVLNSLSSQGESKITESANIFLQGFPGKSFTIASGDKALTKGVTILRGCRPYMAFVVTSEDKIKDKDVSDFLASFDFIDYKTYEWRKYTSTKNNFSVNVPSEMKINRDSSSYDNSYTETYNNLDRNSGISYVVSVERFAPYDFIEKEEYYRTKQKDYIGFDDSLVWARDVTANGVKGKDLLIKIKTTHNYKRIAFFPNGENVYILLCFIPIRYSETSDVNGFYSSFQFTSTPKEATIFTSKAKMLIDALSSSDSATFEKAKNSLYGYNFQKSDLPLIYERLKKSFPDDSYEYGKSKYMLLSRLEKVNDKTTTPFLKDLYQFADTNSEFRVRVLQPLLNIGTDEAIDLFFELSKEEKFEVDYLPFDFFSPVSDSLELNKKIYARLFPLYKKKGMGGKILGLGNTLIDSNAIALSFFDPYKKELLEYAKESLNKEQENDSYYYIDNKQVIYLLSKINQDNSIADFLKSAATCEQTDLRLEAIKAQLRNGYPIESKNLEKIAADKSLRVELYKVLLEKNKASLFPSKWLTQAHFAESELYNYMIYADDYYPEQIVMAGSKVVTYKGREQKFYLFKYNFGEKEWYAGLVGPYPLNKNEISIEPELIKTSYDDFKSKSINEHFDAFLKE